MRVPVPPHFSFEHTVESHGWYLLAPFRWDRKERVLRRPEVAGDGVVDLEFRFLDGALEISVAAGFSTPNDALKRVATPLKRVATRMFQLDVDTSEFIALAAGSDRHRWAAEAKFGRLLCGSTLFEDVVKIIATTNTTWTQTKRMVSLLVDKCGRKSPLGLRAFPSPRDIARFSAAELQDECRLGYRAKSIHALATGMASATIDIDAITDPSQSTDGLFESYRTLPGIGPYGAAHLLAMDGRHDFIAVDTEFRRFVSETYHGGRRVKEKTMLRRYAKWGRWKYLAYWSELWSSVAERLQPK